MADRDAIATHRHLDGAAHNDDLTFGDVLRRLRRDAGLSQEGLAERANVSWRTISDLERGIKRRPQQETRRLLADALGLSAADRTAFETAARGERKVSLSLIAAPSPMPTDALPATVTPLVGRADAIAAVRDRIVNDDVRLLTITGPGGVGKTRLALAVAATVRHAFPDGVWFVPLAAVRDPTLVAPSIAQAIGVNEQARQTTVQTLHARLRSATALLVLDNFEQLTPAAPAIAALLAACPRIRVLVTSRAALRLYGEQEYPLAPLPVPAPESDPEIISRAAAVELFRQRAAAIRPGFTISAENAPRIAAICAVLDGIPLAIELAAARIRLFSPADLLARLTESHGDALLSLLTSGARDLPPRQQTMRDAIAWSYALLSPTEQALFRRLTVFVGGWTLDAAASVCRDDDGGDLETGIAALIDQSMVRTTDGAAGDVRFQMLETVREFGWQQLVTSRAAVALKDRHLAWYVTFAEAAAAEIDGPQQGMWLARLTEEYGNLRAALATARTRGAVTSGLRLAVALGPFWQRFGRYSEGREWLDALLNDAQDTGDIPLALHARALNAAGALAATQGDAERAQAMHEQAYRLASQLDDPALYAATLVCLGRTAEMRGDFGTAFTHIGDAITRYREIGDKRGIATALVQMGAARQRHGTYAESRTAYEESLALFRHLGDQRGMALSTFNLGTIAYFFNDLAQAETLLQQGLMVYQEVGQKPGMASCLNNLALVALRQQDYPRALVLQERALALRREIADKRGEANALNNIGLVAIRLGDLDRAETMHAEGLALFRDIRDEWGVAMSLNNLGIVAAARGDLSRATTLCTEALAMRREHGHRQGIAESTYRLGLVMTERCDLERAAALLRESLTVYRDMGTPSHIADCLLALGDLARVRGDLVRAVRLCAAGLTCYENTATPARPEGQTAANRIRATAEARLDHATFTAAWEAGTASTLAQIIDEALMPERA